MFDSGESGVTFFIVADPHIGAKGSVPFVTAMIEGMNTLPGTPYPWGVRGKVDEPRGVLIPGDLTDFGTPGQWKTYVRLFGLTGTEGLLRYPVYEGTGNHDRYMPLYKPVLKGVRRRQIPTSMPASRPVTSWPAARGRLEYSWDWDHVHLVCLDDYPDEAASRWLARDLAAVGRERPVVIFFHYVAAETTPGKSYWNGPPKQVFLETIYGYNVVGIFHGHWHARGYRRWEGWDVYNVSAPRAWDPTFQVVRITRKTMTVTTWDWKSKQWDTSATRTRSIVPSGR